MSFILKSNSSEQLFLVKRGIVRITDCEQWFRVIIRMVKGPEGGPRSIFTCLLFVIERNGTYQKLFFGLKNIVPSKVIKFSICENT